MRKSGRSAVQAAAVPRWLGQRLLYVVRMSDIGDSRASHFGVFAPLAEQLLGTDWPSTAREVYDVAGDAGLTVVDARRFFAMVAAGDFVAVDALFAPRDRVATIHHAFVPAVTDRDRFLSKLVAAAALDFWEQTRRCWDRAKLGEAWRRMETARHLLYTGRFELAGHPVTVGKTMCAAEAAALRAAVKRSKLRGAPDVADVDAACAAVLAGTLGHRVRVPVQGEWKFEPMEFRAGSLFNIDLSPKGTQ